MQYLTIEQAAEYCTVSKSTFEKWLAKRIVPHRRIGRIVRCNPAELDAALDRFKVDPIGTPKQRRPQASQVAKSGKQVTV